METGQAKPQFSIPSIIAIGAALASLFVGAVGGLILALVAIVFGIIGFMMSMSPSVRGGFISILSLLLAAVGVIIAVFRALTWIF